MPKVSIIVPVYNGQQFIAATINSVLAQTYKDWELIIVDDGSTDETASIIRNSHIPLIYLYQNNRGPSAARNFGIKEAKGDYVAFLDADDLWYPNFLSVATSKLDTIHDSIVGVCAGWEYVDGNGVILPHTRRTQRGYLDLKHFLYTNPFPIHSFLLMKSILLSSGDFDENIFAMEDWDLWLRISAEGGRFYCIDTCLVQYRLLAASNSRNTERMRQGRIRALEKLFDRSDLSDCIKRKKLYAFSKALLQNSVELFSQGKIQEAQDIFSEAVSLSPNVLLDDETYYSIACVDQPIGYKSTAFKLDLTVGEKRLIDTLKNGVSEIRINNEKWADLSSYMANVTLGNLAYRQNNPKQARQYFLQAIKYEKIWIFKNDFLLLLLKTFLRQELLDTLRNVREALFHRSNISHLY